PRGGAEAGGGAGGGGRRGGGARKAGGGVGGGSAGGRRDPPAGLTDTAVSSIRALASDLPAVWSAPTTTPADRQRIARLLLERVVVTVDKASERVDVMLHWVGGAVRPHTITRPVTRYSQQSDYPRLVARLRELCTRRLNSARLSPPL